MGGTVDSETAAPATATPSSDIPGQDSGTWLAIRDAAEIVGISRQALRKRVQRGTVRSQKRPDGEWDVLVRWDAEGGTPSLVDQDATVAPRGTGTPDGTSSATSTVGSRDTPETATTSPAWDRAVSRMADVIADQQARIDELAERAEHLAATAAMFQERAANLSQQLDVTQQRAALAEGRLAQLEAGPIMTAPPPANDPTPVQETEPVSPASTARPVEAADTRSWWQRLWGG